MKETNFPRNKTSKKVKLAKNTIGELMCLFVLIIRTNQEAKHLSVVESSGPYAATASTKPRLKVVYELQSSVSMFC